MYKNARRNNNHNNTYQQPTRDECCLLTVIINSLDRPAAPLGQEAQHSSANTSSESKKEESSVCLHDLAAPSNFLKVVP